METNATTEMEGTTNATAMACPGVGNRWWVFLVTISVIYIVALSLCVGVYTLYWLVAVKFKISEKHTSTVTLTKFHDYAKIFRDRIRQLKSGDTIPGKILISVTLVCNLAYIALAVYRSFPPRTVEMCIKTSDPEVIVELILSCELLIFSIVRFLASKNIIIYWINPFTIVDVCTLPHIFISIALGVDWIGLRYLRYFWLTQITTVIQFTPIVPSQDAVDIINLVIYFLVLWLTSSGILYLIEVQGDFWKEVSNSSPHSVLIYMYLTMVTMSTVGYGDFSPVTDLGRTFMIFFIVAGLAFFAAILPKIVEVTTGIYARTQYARFDTTRVPRHIIVCGHITAVTAEDFLKDFLHKDRGDDQTHVLFLHPVKPDRDLKNVLRSYYTRVQYLLGSVLNGNDLQKAKISMSAAIFILANKHTENPTEEDHANLLRVVSVKNTTDEVPVIIQLLHSFSKIQVSNIEGWSFGRDIAVCLNELKLGLLAQSCLCPGFSTLIANLFYTSDFPVFSSFSSDDAWKEHYIKGASNEVYSSTFSQFFDGRKFHDVASICFKNLNLVLLALEFIEPKKHYFYVNPSPETHPKMRVKSSSMLGYFIAQDQSHVSDVSRYCECCIGNQHLETSTNIDLRRTLSVLRRNVTLKREGNADDSVKDVSHGNVNDNGDLIIHFESHSGAKDNPKEAVEPLELEMSKVDKVEASLGSEPDLSDDDDFCVTDTFQLHICDPIQLEESILNPDVLFDRERGFRPVANIRDHIVLCLFADDKSPLLGLHNFLKPLRRKNLPPESIKPVVIVCEKVYIEKEWPIICKIPKVYLVKGSPLLSSNLRAAQVMHCSVCIVLTMLHTSSSNEPAIEDKEAILCSLSIRKKLKKINKNTRVITDLRQESNVQFLDFGDEDKPDERIYKAQPFACGEAFSVSMFDSVTSSAFHGPGTLYLVEDLIHASGTKTHCQVVSVPIRDTQFSGRKFGDFYIAQLKEYNVCLGVSRKLGPTDNQSYVITCPDSDLILEETDDAFILMD